MVSRPAFTMVEIMVVVIVIAVLATLIAPKFLGRVGATKQATAKVNIGNIEQAINLFQTDYERYPANLDELVVRPSDITEEKWMLPDVKQKDLIDPWGRPYLYACPGQHGKFDLYSYGADGQEGGTGDNADIVNW